MKVSIISDTHFGFKWGEERGSDPFENAREAFEKTKDSDLIILPGDIFDRKIPKQEVLDEATEVFQIPMEGERTVEADRDLGIHGNGVPLVAIHGTHERRPSSYTNPIELMDQTGHLLHLDNDRVVFEKDGEKVAVHGMSGVPEKYAPNILGKFDPQPVEDAFNILVIHQSVEGFVYTPEDKRYLQLEDFPEGFDLIVDGHIHWYNIERFPGEKPLVFPGSTVTTQMRKVEAEKSKGFLELDTRKNELRFRELESPREVYYIEMEIDGESWSEIKDMVREKLEGIEEDGKPLVNLRMEGETDSRINPRELKQMFRDKMFLNVNSSLKAGGSEDMDDISDLDPVEEGKEVLSEKLDSSLDIDQDEFFQLLERGNASEALKALKSGV